MEEVIRVTDCVETIGDYDISIHKAIIIPKDVTNGDIIEIMFSQLKIKKLPDIVIVFGEDNIFQHHYPIEWWNTPYKVESEDQE